MFNPSLKIFGNGDKKNLHYNLLIFNLLLIFMKNYCVIIEHYFGNLNFIFRFFFIEYNKRIVILRKPT